MDADPYSNLAEYGSNLDPNPNPLFETVRYEAVWHSAIRSLKLFFFLSHFFFLDVFYNHNE